MSEIVVTIDNEKFEVVSNQFQNISLNNKMYEVEISQLSDHTFKISIDHKIFHITTNKLGKNKYSFLVGGHYFESIVNTKLEEKVSLLLGNGSQNNSTLKIKSPMPGLITKIYKNVGEEIKTGKPILLLEAMKMENDILSPLDGVISEIRVEEGSSVEKGQILVVIY